MKKVLVCDDDKDVLFIMTFTLTGIGWEVITSDDCKNIIEKVAENQPSVIIMDYVIPDIGGLETTRILKNHPVFKDIPVILYTSASNISELAELAGADFHYSKPIHIKKLEKLMDKAYDQFIATSFQSPSDQSEIA
jgi:CheY-like chemotaxis protein